MCSEEEQLVLMDLQELAVHIKTAETESNKKEVRGGSPGTIFGW